MSTAVNEDLIRDVVAEVLSRLGRSPASGPVAAGQRGVFRTVDEAVRAAKAAQQQLVDRPLSDRAAAVQAVRDVMLSRIDELARLELEETKIGRLDHKKHKLRIIAEKVPGMEMIMTEAVSGDMGLTVIEHAPFGVIGVVTPLTHVVPTFGCNAIMMISGGNSLVCNPHPSGIKIALYVVRLWNEEIHKRIGIDNLICAIEQPTLETANEIFTHPDIAMLCVTGGPGVVKAAMASNKKAVVAGPGNPPVVVDETADLDRAAAKIIQGASYDNNLLCTGEKEVFAVAAIFDELMRAMERHGAMRLNAEQIEALVRVALHRDEKSGHWIPDRQFVGRDPQVLGEAIGVRVPQGVELLFGETDETNPFVSCEQMMPFVPFVRVPDVETAIQKAKQYEHGFGHTAVMHSSHVGNLTRMGKVMDTTLFFKNGATNEGEGFVSYSIATPTGEGPTSPLTFTRVRRCIMVGELRII